jgi:transcriptional regulator with XRE-family HTH domain
MIDQAFAVVLIRLRKKAKLSQESFASESGLHRTYISQLERGLKSPSLRTMKKITDVLGISLSEFIAQVEEEIHHISSK